MLKLLPKLLSFEHKCKQTKCKQMSEEFENMKKFILYSNHLNVYYLNQMKNIENCCNGDNQRLFTKEKQNKIKSIESEFKKINQTLRLILKEDKHSNKKSDIKVLMITRRMSQNLIEFLLFFSKNQRNLSAICVANSFHRNY